MVLWFLCVCWGSFLSLLGSCSSDVLVLEPAAFCYERPRGRVACLASLQACSVAYVSPVPCERRHSFHSMQRPLVLVVFLVVVFAWFGLVSLLSLCFFACLRSFTDWCIAHRQQSREQKNCVAFLRMQQVLEIRSVGRLENFQAVQRVEFDTEGTSCWRSFGAAEFHVWIKKLHLIREELRSYQMPPCELTDKNVHAGLW